MPFVKLKKATAWNAPDEPMPNIDKSSSIDYTDFLLKKDTLLKKVNKDIMEMEIDAAMDMVKQFPSASEQKMITRLLVCCRCGKNINEKKEEFWQLGQLEKNERKYKQKYICYECKNFFKRCENCDYLFPPENIHFNHCPLCIKNAPRNYIRNYTFKVERELEFKHKIINASTSETDKEGKPKDQIYYGVELELASDNIGLDVLIVNDIINPRHDRNKAFAFMKKDTSIRPNRSLPKDILQGFEIVSVPATLDAHYYLWDEFFEKLPNTVWPDRSCGMHIHASRNRMSDLQVGKILAFIHAKENQKFIELIAGREKPVYLGQTEDGKIKGYSDLEPKKITDMKIKVDRHCALNLNNENTIEFRIFASTRDKRIFLKNIEFCKAMIKWCDWAATSIKQATNWREFVAFVQKNRKEYEYLSLFLETPSAKELIG